MMIKDLIDRVLASFKEDCDNITNLYGEEYSCGYCKHRKICEAIYKLKIKRWLIMATVGSILVLIASLGFAFLLIDDEYILSILLAIILIVGFLFLIFS